MFRNPQDFAGASAGIVSPLGSSSFSLPNVERALSEMESGVGPSGLGERAGAGGLGASTRLAPGRTGTLGASTHTGYACSPVVLVERCSAESRRRTEPA